MVSRRPSLRLLKALPVLVPQALLTRPRTFWPFMKQKRSPAALPPPYTLKTARTSLSAYFASFSCRQSSPLPALLPVLVLLTSPACSRTTCSTCPACPFSSAPSTCPLCLPVLALLALPARP